MLRRRTLPLGTLQCSKGGHCLSALCGLSVPCIIIILFLILLKLSSASPPIFFEISPLWHQKPAFIIYNIFTLLSFIIFLYFSGVMSSSVIPHFSLNYFISSFEVPQYKGICNVTFVIFLKGLISRKNPVSINGANFFAHSANFSLF